jgi:hypothetical protein
MAVVFHRGDDRSVDWPRLTLAAAATGATALACLTAAAVLLPSALVLPIFGAALLMSAVVLALLATVIPFDAGGGKAVFWRISGGLALVGASAALLGDAEQAFVLLEQRQGE